MNRPIPPEALAALQAGRMIEAIKIVRQTTGLDLKAAKELVEAHIGGTPQTPIAIKPENLPPEVLAEIQAGRKIEAIKLLRQKTGLGLKESKDLVDGVASESPSYVVEDSAGNRKTFLILVILAAAAYAIYYFYNR